MMEEVRLVKGMRWIGHARVKYSKLTMNNEAINRISWCRIARLEAQLMWVDGNNNR